MTGRATVVVVGGGCGGMYCARHLERKLPAGSAEIMLVSPENFMLYTPLLPEAASGTIEPRHVVVPLRRVLRRTRLLIGRATDFDVDRRTVTVAPPEGEARTIAWDRLVLATGSVSRLPGIPGLADHARGFKTLPEGIYLRNHVLRQLELADADDDVAERTARLTFVVVGAGYAGTELVAELQALTSRAIEAYPGLRPGDELPTRTFVWTAGVRPQPMMARIGLPTDEHGRLLVDRYLTVQGRDDVFALGDTAAVPDPANPERPSPPTAQHALRQAMACAANVAASLGEGDRRRFDYKGLGLLVNLGQFKGVGRVLGVPISGFLGWFITRRYHLAAMPTWGRRFRVGLDWGVALISPSDIAELGSLGRYDALARQETTSLRRRRDGRIERSLGAY